MFYHKIIEKMMKEEANDINKMYLQEIKLKWENFERSAARNEENNEELTKALNDFTKVLSNRKLKFSQYSKKGFKKNSQVFSPSYLANVISIFIERSGITEHKGINWGFQSFSTNLKFNPKNLCSIEKDPAYEFSASPEFLQLAQKMDFQFRIHGKRNFKKYEITLPLIVFHIVKNLTPDEFIKFDYYAKVAKNTFEKSHTVIITETLDTDFVPDLSFSPIDVVFILRKQQKSKTEEEISLEVIDAIEKKILDFIHEQERKSEAYKNTGIIS